MSADPRGKHAIPLLLQLHPLLPLPAQPGLCMVATASCCWRYKSQDALPLRECGVIAAEEAATPQPTHGIRVKADCGVAVAGLAAGVDQPARGTVFEGSGNRSTGEGESKPSFFLNDRSREERERSTRPQPRGSGGPARLALSQQARMHCPTHCGRSLRWWRGRCRSGGRRAACRAPRCPRA